ncbi:GDSL-type esterase/lipase family protein [Cellvibrio sp.]|uniref:GDSL-type esterase/lipase family protein n=1 Tax=Cellvibrio sp. TaxID=1965322 RepID=UPI00396474C0
MKRHNLLAFTFIALNLLGSAFCQASEDLTPSGTNPTPRTKEFSWMSVDTWNKMYADDIAVAEKGGVDLLFVGDSITAGWNAEIYQKYFGVYNPANFGIGGDHTGNLLWRLKYGHAEKLHPKVVVMLIGVNNFGHLNETPDQVFQGIKACLLQLRKIYPNAKILVNGVLPFEESVDSPKRAMVKAVNAKVKTLNDNQHVFVKDYGSAFLQPDGSITKDVMGDFLHPTAKGYQLWVDAMYPDIQMLMSK